MKQLLAGLDPLLENRIRLGVMSLLVVREEADFNSMKQMLGVTDGNLASHVATLERNRYLTVRKAFVGRKPQTTYTITEAGRRAFSDHVEALERLLRKAR
ncbi:MAG: transcriptional regulator [Bacteroidota bacterium]